MATPATYTYCNPLSLHDALPICLPSPWPKTNQKQKARRLWGMGARPAPRLSRAALIGPAQAGIDQCLPQVLPVDNQPGDRPAVPVRRTRAVDPDFGRCGRSQPLRRERPGTETETAFVRPDRKSVV